MSSAPASIANKKIFKIKYKKGGITIDILVASELPLDELVTQARLFCEKRKLKLVWVNQEVYSLDELDEYFEKEAQRGV